MTAKLKIGDVLCGRYPIEGILGEGGMGAVYEASDLSSKRRWAVKEMSDSFDSEEERASALSGFKAEADILCELEHPNLPRITHCFEENGRHYIVMDLVKGDTAEKYLKKHGRLDLDEALKIVKQLTSVLSYLHKLNPPLIFRDMKPANVMIMPDGQVKLIDFGIARFFSKDKTADTQAFGTPGYAAPEQYGQGQSDARTDIYALGACLHQFLTGADPSLSPFKFEPLNQYRSDLPEGLNDIIVKAVQIDPKMRWQTVSEFEEALLNLNKPRELQSKEPKTEVLSLKSGILKETETARRLYSKLKTNILEPEPAECRLKYFNYSNLFFGKCTADKSYKTTIVLKGRVKGKIKSQPSWLSCSPSYADGENVSIDVIADTLKIPKKGEHFGILTFEDESINVRIIAEPPQMSCLYWLGIIFFTFISILPWAGLGASAVIFILMLAAHKFNRIKVLAFFLISLAVSVLSSCFSAAVFYYLNNGR